MLQEELRWTTSYLRRFALKTEYKVCLLPQVYGCSIVPAFEKEDIRTKINNPKKSAF